MKIKLDENLPEALVPVLAAFGHDTDTVPQESLTGQADETVWEAAQQAGRLLLRLRDPGRLALLQIVEMLFKTEPVDSWRGCLVVATERKLRVLRPQGQEEQ